MSASSQRPAQPMGLSSFRNPVACLFITMLTVYVLYSSKLILRKDEYPKCSLQTSDVSAKENLQTVLPQPANSSSDESKKQEQPPPVQPVIIPYTPPENDTEIKHVVFGIAASSNLWEKRKEYIKLWWRPEETRGVVWLDESVNASKDEVNLPEIRISGDTSKFQYTNRQGKRSALRISRVVSETLRLGVKDVRWFVMGDDDTVFIIENVLRVLSKYDHKQFYYIGSSSESHIQNIFFSYGMAYGGGGFAISYPLAKELEKIQDGCIQRYPALYGSDDRIQACMAELGVPLTKETGFHQVSLKVIKVEEQILF
ncbi:unnamed protein product [Fraxinus pennsylvanica]|uniref:Uncharacterized protein n=1 Tax=Fraxinus pennsylvanica TaxID=56036 RepID=A0AAD2DLP6_9LAMI|nr:unnamed protein product [Fraxinus pennsylvanica]